MMPSTALYDYSCGLDSYSPPQEMDHPKKGALEDPERPTMPDDNGLTQQITLEEGEQRFHKLGWKGLTICLIVEAIALGSLSLPSAFADLGMVLGILITIGFGILAMYTSYLIGQVKLRYPHVSDYADAVGLIWGRFGYCLASAMFVGLLILVVASHVLTGTIAFIAIVDRPDICALVWGAISAVLLFLLALPPTFSDFAILGYIDFLSIILAIGITIIATGVDGVNAEGGLGVVGWRFWPARNLTFSSAFLSITNILFAYSFALVQFSFMDEMHTPSDYIKSTYAIGTIEIFIYTLTGALIYAFVGDEVGSPALLSADKLIARIAFGVALPVIYISGSINSTVLAKYIIRRAFPYSNIRFVNDVRGWIVWVFIIAIATITAWIIAEAIPFFSALLGAISSLFISGFTVYFPAIFWFTILKKGKWNANWANLALSLLNAGIIVVGMIVLVCGTYASVQSIVDSFSDGSVGTAFACASSQYL